MRALPVAVDGVHPCQMLCAAVVVQAVEDATVTSFAGAVKPSSEERDEAREWLQSNHLTMWLGAITPAEMHVADVAERVREMVFGESGGAS